MKTTVLAIVLAWAMGLGAQTPTPPQFQDVTSGHAVPTNLPGPIIEDPAEYDAYVNAFLAQYPNSVMKVHVLRLIAATNKLMGTLSKSTR